jgi:hypothetical protein
LQFAQLKGMWIPTSFDAIATVRLLGQYRLVGHNIRSSDAPSVSSMTNIGANRLDRRSRPSVRSVQN